MVTIVILFPKVEDFGAQAIDMEENLPDDLEELVLDLTGFLVRTKIISCHFFV